MTNEIIGFYREHLKPIIQKMLLKTNYQGQGEVDYEEFGRDFDELLDLAIIGMQSNSDEDCISRQAVLDAFNLSEKTRKYGGDHSGYDTMMLYEIQDVIEALPSIQPKPKTDVLDKIRAEIEQKIEQERFARSVFRGEEKDAVNAEQCTGSIFAYNNVIKIIDKYKAEGSNKDTDKGNDCNSCKYQKEVDGSNCYECVKGMRNNYTAEKEWLPQYEGKWVAESDIEKRKECPHKPCINHENGCEEWAGCPCVYYKTESEG